MAVNTPITASVSYMDSDWEEKTFRERVDDIIKDENPAAPDRLKKIGKACAAMLCCLLFLPFLSWFTLSSAKGYENAKAATITPWGDYWRETEHVGEKKTPVYADKDLVSGEGRRLRSGRRLSDEHRDWVIGLNQNMTEEHLEKLNAQLPADTKVVTQGHVKGGVPEIVVSATLAEIMEYIKDVDGINYVEQDCPGGLVPDVENIFGALNTGDDGDDSDDEIPTGDSDDIPVQGEDNDTETEDTDPNVTTGRRLKKRRGRIMADKIIDIYHRKIRKLQAKDGRRLACEEETQKFPDWGLDRIDQVDSAVDQNYGCHPSKLNYGEGVNIYVVDTGVRYTHEDFEGRAFPALSWESGSMVECDKTDTSCANDDDGHGTHCAAITGGKKYGVAKKATIWGIRTFDTKGGMYISWALKAIDWVIAKGKKPAVMSMSVQMLGTWKPGLDAITEATEAGIAVVVAAGNYGLSDQPNACDYSPAYVPSAITVGAVDRGDYRSAFSNTGSCIDIFAPGRDILSASYKSDTGTKVLSGTSQATPLVSGAVALLLAHNNELSVKQINLLLKQAAIESVQDAGDGSPDDVLFVGPGFETLADNVDRFQPQDGGKGRACRGRNEADGDMFSQFWSQYWGTSAYDVEYVSSLEDCKALCESAKSCTGIEYKFQGTFNFNVGRCELWIRDIGCSVADENTMCYKYGR